MKKNLLLMIIFISLGITGCSNMGNEQIKNKEFISQNVAKGKTKNEIKNSLGEPSDVTFSGNGNETWLYIRSETQTRFTSFIPYISVIAGGVDSSTDKLYILFNSEDKVIKFTTTNIKGGAGSIFD